MIWTRRPSTQRVVTLLPAGAVTKPSSSSDERLFPAWFSLHPSSERRIALTATRPIAFIGAPPCCAKGPYSSAQSPGVARSRRRRHGLKGSTGCAFTDRQGVNKFSILVDRSVL